MNILQRIFLFALIVGLLVWTGAGLAGAQTTTTVSNLGPHDCAQKKMSFLFWPSGHGASTQYSFPAMPTPHVEAWMVTPTGPLSESFAAQFVASLDSNGVFFYGAACTPTTTASAKVKAMRSPKKQTVNALLECSFKKNATVTIVPGTTSSTMTVVANNESVVTLKLGATAGTARYNSKLCKSKPPIA
jgi:hypothetical protein